MPLRGIARYANASISHAGGFGQRESFDRAAYEPCARVSTGPCGRKNSPKPRLATCQCVGLHTAAAEMAQSILLLLCLLNAAHGTLFPAATPAARLDKRQYVGAATIWSPTTLGSTLACMQAPEWSRRVVNANVFYRRAQHSFWCIHRNDV
jgi:hypothetical protein